MPGPFAFDYGILVLIALMLVVKIIVEIHFLRTYCMPGTVLDISHVVPTY